MGFVEGDHAGSRRCYQTRSLTTSLATGRVRAGRPASGGLQERPWDSLGTSLWGGPRWEPQMLQNRPLMINFRDSQVRWAASVGGTTLGAGNAPKTFCNGQFPNRRGSPGGPDSRVIGCGGRWEHWEPEMLQKRPALGTGPDWPRLPSLGYYRNNAIPRQACLPRHTVIPDWPGGRRPPLYVTFL